MSIARTFNSATKKLQIHFLAVETSRRENLPWNLQEEEQEQKVVHSPGPVKPDTFDNYYAIWESLQLCLTLIVGLLAVAVNR